MAIVKADGYGHGAVPCAHALMQANEGHKGTNVAARRAAAFGVAACEEGVALRESGITAPVLIMGFTPEPLLPLVLQNGLTQTVFTAGGAKLLAIHAARYKKRAAIHIEVDTGMSRLGFLPTEKSVAEVLEFAENPNLRVEGIFTHFATSDAMENSFMHTQRERFLWFLAQLEKRGLKIPMVHMANSGALVQVLRKDGGFYDISQKKDLLRDGVRPGILLYGHAPSAEMTGVCATLGLKPVMRLMTQVSMVKHLPAGAGISYGHMYNTERPSVIAVLPVGYADGYPRRLSRAGRVMVNGQFAPIAGAICMDQCMADVTDIPDVKPGDPVVMLDTADNHISAECLADTVGTISYEILCGIGKRVPRVYVSDT